MSNTIKILAKLSRWICVIAIVALIGFSLAACEEEDNGGGGGGGGTGGGSKPDYTGTDIADLATWLAAQPANNAATAYSVKLNVSSLGGNSNVAGSVGKVLKDNSTKYVSLDLSGCTFTSMVQTFYGCSSLTSVTIPDSVTTIEYYAFAYCTSLTSVTFQGTITSANFDSDISFLGDLREKYLAGGIGTYTTTAPVSSSSVWTKQ